MTTTQRAPGPLQPGEALDPRARYLPTTPETASWGWLPGAEDRPVLTIDPGDTVVVDTVSHEGVLEDQGRDPVAFFGGHGVAAADVLGDAVAIAASGLRPAGSEGGPHVVTGPIAVRGAEPGDVVTVEVLDLQLRAGYGVISNRHGKGALPGELPVVPGTVSVFATVDGDEGVIGVPGRPGRSLRFPLRPFLGLVGVATPGRLHSTPPGRHGGNLDVSVLGVGSRLHLRVQVPGAGVHVGDPHYAMGDGEVALTAFEAPLRATLRITSTRAADLRPGIAELLPLGETPQLWVPIGLDEDLGEAMRDCVRRALGLMQHGFDVDRATSLAYLSAAVDFSVSQVVDVVAGVHAAIRKADLREVTGDRPAALFGG
ncbi:acetamidase/formamidase family protein [Modestobacter italicus]|nr:acetamidase/formamidase family protein [Modestobacter marinus]